MNILKYFPILLFIILFACQTESKQTESNEKDFCEDFFSKTFQVLHEQPNNYNPDKFWKRLVSNDGFRNCDMYDSDLCMSNKKFKNYLSEMFWHIEKTNNYDSIRSDIIKRQLEYYYSTFRIIDTTELGDKNYIFKGESGGIYTTGTVISSMSTVYYVSNGSSSIPELELYLYLKNEKIEVIDRIRQFVSNYDDGEFYFKKILFSEVNKLLDRYSLYLDDIEIKTFDYEVTEDSSCKFIERTKMDTDHKENRYNSCIQELSYRLHNSKKFFSVFSNSELVTVYDSKTLKKAAKILAICENKERSLSRVRIINIKDEAINILNKIIN